MKGIKNVIAQLVNEWICDEVPAITSDNEFVSTVLHKKQELIRCKDCAKKGNSYLCRFDRDIEEHGSHRTDADDEWFCADGVAKDINVPDKGGM